MYGLLIGLWVFHEDEDDSIVQDQIVPQESAYIDTQRKSLKNRKQVRWLLLLFFGGYFV